ncbi:MAG: SGNH/GDSL hydrolase family protein [Pseudomonadota bacterium]
MRYVTLALVVLWAAAFPSFAQSEDDPRIQLLGDSLMATHMLTGRAIPNVLARTLDEKVDNNALTGAMIRGISLQYEPGELDWVVLNGGGNDLWLGCGCNECTERMAKVISEDGASGRLPDLVSRIRADGARVLYVGYLRSPGFGSPIEHCRDDGDEMERRIVLMARAMEGVWFLSNKELVPSGDKSFHAFDRIHPSPKGSRAIGRRIASAIRQLDDTR